jgi:hypothetical protein
MPFRPVESFPTYKSGNVFIRTDLNSPLKQWQLHSSVLSHFSSWFSNRLAGIKAAWASYTITEVDGRVQLVPQPASGERPVIEVVEEEIVSDISIKIEEDTEIFKDTSKPYLTDHPTTTAIYNQIFASFYNITLTLPSVTSNITTALHQSEQFIEIAGTLNCLPLIAPHLNAALLQYRLPLLQYRLPLLKAIKADPPRWLLLSLTLKNTSIYTESLIHLAGAYPCHPWSTKRSVLPSETQRLIIKKSEMLDKLCLETERDLLLLTINAPNSQPVSPMVPNQFDTWYVVATFRDVLAKELLALDKNRKAALLRGRFFRKIAQGGSNYMAYEEMRRMMEQVMPSAVADLGEDLAMLKEAAKKDVKLLARNEALLDVGVEENGVGWLTCTKMGKEDIPWLAEREEC